MAETEIPLAGIPVKEEKNKCRLARKFKVEFPSRTEWNQGEINFDGDTLVAYTDGSLNEAKKAGAGLFLEGSGATKSYPLGKLTTVFQAEVYAILQATRQSEVKEASVKTFIICSDSQAALKALSAPHISSPLVSECWDALEKVAKEKVVKLIWVPGHTGVPGNEEADKGAKTGASLPFIGPEPAVDWSKRQIKSVIKEWIWQKANLSWTNIEGCRQTKMLLPVLNRKKSRWLLNLSKPSLRNITGILTGHCTLGRHLALMSIGEDPLCKVCGEEEETAYHFIGYCEGYSRLRFEIFGTGELKEEELEAISWQDILQFINKSRKFNGEVVAV